MRHVVKPAVYTIQRTTCAKQRAPHNVQRSPRPPPPTVLAKDEKMEWKPERHVAATAGQAHSLAGNSAGESAGRLSELCHCRSGARTPGNSCSAFRAHYPARDTASSSPPPPKPGSIVNEEARSTSRRNTVRSDAQAGRAEKAGSSAAMYLLHVRSSVRPGRRRAETGLIEQLLVLRCQRLMRLLEPLDLLLCARRRLLRRSKPRHDLHASLQQQNHPSWPTDPPRSHRVGRRLFTSASSLPPATGTAWRLHDRASPRKPYRGQTSLRVGDRVHNAAR